MLTDDFANIILHLSYIMPHNIMSVVFLSISRSSLLLARGYSLTKLFTPLTCVVLLFIVLLLMRNTATTAL